jgi:hypothetical protein
MPIDLYLIQQVSAAVEYSGKSKECRYKFDVDEAVLRLRFPKFSTHIRVTHGPVAECVMDAILDHGRATWEQIKAACSDINEDKLKEAGDLLLEHKYLTKVVSSLLEDEPASSSSHHHSAPTRPSPHPSKPGGKRGAPSSPGQQRPSKVRRLEDDDMSWNLYSQGDDYADAMDGISATAALWRVNSEAFTWDFRSVAVGHLAQDISGSECGSLMPTLLRAVRSSALAHRVQSVSVDAVLELASEEKDPKQANVHLSWESVSEKLMTLAQDGLVKRVNDFAAGTTVFEPELRKLHRAVRQDIVERVVEAKMGWQARRVLKLLLHHQLLESKTVWDLAMLPKKDANEVNFITFTNKLRLHLKHGSTLIDSACYSARALAPLTPLMPCYRSCVECSRQDILGSKRFRGPRITARSGHSSCGTSTWTKSSGKPLASDERETDRQVDCVCVCVCVCVYVCMYVCMYARARFPNA